MQLYLQKADIVGTVCQNPFWQNAQQKDSEKVPSRNFHSLKISLSSYFKLSDQSQKGELKIGTSRYHGLAATNLIYSHFECNSIFLTE